jgi:mannose-6-phosphate isomerase-like protein (cupin superfamily)
VVIHGAALPVIDFGGLLIRDYTANVDLPSSVASIEVPAGARHPLAFSTKCDKYYAVVEGEIEFTLDGTANRLAAGDFCHVPRGTKFSYRNAALKPARLLLFHTPRFDLKAEVLLD